MESGLKGGGLRRDGHHVRRGPACAGCLLGDMRGLPYLRLPGKGGPQRAFFRPETPGPPEIWANGDKVYTSFPTAPYPWNKGIRLTLVWAGDHLMPGDWSDALADGMRIQQALGSADKVSAVCYPLQADVPL